MAEREDGTSSKPIYQPYDEGDLKLWNWGAFVFGPLWALRFGLEWWFLLSMLPGVDIPARFYMGWYGNRLAYEKSRVRSIDRFMKAQHAWSMWGISILVLFLLASIVSVVT